MKNIAVFASGRGSNFQSVHNEIKAGNIPANVVCVISDKANPPVFEKAHKDDIPTHHINRKQFDSEKEFTDKLLEVLARYETDLIILAGYLKKIPPKVVEEYRYSMLNIHPALLPKFGGKGYYGMKVHEAVIEAGEEKSGATVHFVDEKYDHGPIILQKEVDVKPDDSPQELSDRVLEVEHSILPRVVKAYCEDNIEINKEGVVLKDE